MAASIVPFLGRVCLAAEANYDEAAVRQYTLPDILAGPDGTAVTTADGWRDIARPHQLKLLETFVYGRRLPAVPVSVTGKVERADCMLAGDVMAKRIQATIKLGDSPDALTTDVLLYLPKSARRAPVFLHLNFRGNHAEYPDAGIRLSTA